MTDPEPEGERTDADPSVVETNGDGPDSPAGPPEDGRVLRLAAPPQESRPPAVATEAVNPPPSDKPGRLARIRPSALSGLAILGVLTALSIIGGLAFGDSALGKTCVIGLVPAFSLAFGIVATHWYSKRGLDEQLASEVQNAMYTTLHLKRSVQYVDDRLEEAQVHLEASRGMNALLEVVRAKTATQLSLGTAQQSSRQWESISKTGAQAAQSLFVEDDVELRPQIREGNNPKTVAPKEQSSASGDSSDE